MKVSELYKVYLAYPLVTTDTRNCSPGSIFFALKGENFDGNHFVEEALAKGCEFAVCDSGDVPAGEKIIRVDNSLKTLQKLANYHRRQLKTPVIGITGTNGKTTTKELMAAVLSSTYHVLSTQGNLNNHIGVPLTLLQLRPEHEYAIIEMGANHPGEIKTLTGIAEPDFGIITNVGKAHLEGFGSFEGVIRAKGELYDYLRKTGGTVFLNHENSYLNTIVGNLKKVFYGKTSDSFVWGNAISSFPFLSFEWYRGDKMYPVKTQLVGEYNLENALAAVAVGNYFSVGAHGINKALEEYIPQNNRSQFRDTGKNKLIIDAYNANPTSMAAALENFDKMQVSPKMVILGDMKELGIQSPEEHRKIIDLIEKSAFDKVFLCGPEFSSLPVLHPDACRFEKNEDLIQYLVSSDITGYHILIKGSRGIRLEKTIGFL
ncbi:MAG: UDP-N-acetylmuramoyl-tripeptide--D-alanyl-D-alanine ligase [Dysgonamonadaceae bacterium]|jgi:UDP-N-acetylmuramoyl-tripeptide--D-alanyl-D-alanine ligase|nr:UDP-N-acetylmuramoyl-tripeptide--D-alanyl-D-alanine ligase [Dysgonamonadaceae bacterium]